MARPHGTLVVVWAFCALTRLQAAAADAAVAEEDTPHLPGVGKGATHTGPGWWAANERRAAQNGTRAEATEEARWEHAAAYDKRKRPKERVGSHLTFESLSELEQERAFLMEQAQRYRQLNPAHREYKHEQEPYLPPHHTPASAGPGAGARYSGNAGQQPRPRRRGASKWIEGGSEREDLRAAADNNGAHGVSPSTGAGMPKAEREQGDIGRRNAWWNRDGLDGMPPDDFPSYLSVRPPSPCLRQVRERVHRLTHVVPTFFFSQSGYPEVIPCICVLALFFARFVTDGQA
jgi:hypothetical protein